METAGRGDHRRGCSAAVLCLALIALIVGCPNPPLPQVADPTFSPPEGTYSSPQSVAIMTTMAGAGIRYTIDGSTPTSTVGSLYSSPIDVSMSTTIKAVAYASGYTESEVVSASYEILPEGKDGDRTVSSSGTVVNQYTTLAQNASSGAANIVVGSVTALTDGANPLETGDLLLVIQMQGATLDVSDAISYGTLVTLGGAGLYEFAEVADVVPASTSVSLSSPLINSYSVAGAVQVVRVPQYTTLTINAGASVTAPAWDGATGGVVVLHAAQAITVNGSVDASGKGFRGGPSENDSSGAVVDTITYRSTSSLAGARKGEGIGGFIVSYGRGAPGNGGGGGNAYNAGGGGGSNGRSGSNWTGQGVFDATVTGGSAWVLDPGYSTIASEGGGRGGYSCSSSNLNALTVGPGNSSWLGNYRRERGGLGGHALDNDPSSRLFLGGGGGAGDGDNAHAGAGGSGGGIVIVIVPQVTGTNGRVIANGDAGQPADSSSGDAAGDAAGGGGGGGAVVIKATTIQGISIEAKGGTGGTQTVNNGAEAEGPGGGGGGGYVAISTAVTIAISGGLGGTTTSSALSEFPSNGATRGGDGETLISTSFIVPGT